MDVLPLLALAAVLAGCAAPSTGDDPLISGRPVRWIVVETSVSDIPSLERWPEGSVKPESQVLAMAAVPEGAMTWVPEVHAPDTFVEVLKVDPEGPVGVGEVVTLTVRVGNAKPHAEYQLTAGTTAGDVRILGRRKEVVRGAESVSFTFTNVEDGSGGISIAVRAIQ